MEFAVSNMDLYPIDIPGRPSWGANLEQLVPYLERTGCANFEIHPTRAIVHDIARREASGDTDIIRAVVGSVHQTFNEGTGPFGKIADWRGIERCRDSAVSMRGIARAIGGRIPAVGYPEHLRDGSIATEDTYGIVQPKANVYDMLRLSSNTDLLDAVSLLGFIGICPDTVHARCKGENGTRPPAVAEVWADQFASGCVYQMHVSADRVDLKRLDPELAERSVEEFEAFVSAGAKRALNTELGEMIIAAIENYVPPAGLAHPSGRPVLRQVLEVPPRIGAIRRRPAQHARFVKSLAEIARSVGATPLLRS